MGITAKIEPIDVTFGDTVIYLQRDPSASTHWDALMNVKPIYGVPKKRDTALAALVDALAGMAETPEDAEKVRALDTNRFGLSVLYWTAQEYAREVTGFPTQPSSTSTKGSKTTSNT